MQGVKPTVIPRINPEWIIPDEFEVLEWIPNPDGTRSPVALRSRIPGIDLKEMLTTEEGAPVHRKNRKGEPLAIMHKYRDGGTEEVIGRRSPRGHIRWEPFVRETAEEKSQRERAGKIAQAKDDLAAALVDRGMTAEDLLTRLMGEPEPETVEELAGDWPKHTGGPWYMLSDGTKVSGKDAAHEAQAALDAQEPPG